LHFAFFLQHDCIKNEKRQKLLFTDLRFLTVSAFDDIFCAKNDFHSLRVFVGIKLLKAILNAISSIYSTQGNNDVYLKNFVVI
jgi:hypothetical protein